MRDLVATALLCVAAVEATTPVQIISGSGELLSSASSSVASTLPGGSSVSVVASIGGGHRGRRLLNAVFGTSYPTELSLGAQDEKSAGAWLAASPSTGALVVETRPLATSGEKRPAADAEKLASFSLAVADAVIVHSPAVAPTASLVKETYERLFSHYLAASQGGLPASKQVLVHVTDASVEGGLSESEAVRACKEAWQSASSMTELKGTPFSDCFELELVDVSDLDSGVAAIRSKLSGVGGSKVARPGDFGAAASSAWQAAWTPLSDAPSEMWLRERFLAARSYEAAYSQAQQTLRKWAPAVSKGKMVNSFGPAAGAVLEGAMATFDAGVSECSAASASMIAQRRSRLQKALQNDVQELLAKQHRQLTVSTINKYKSQMLSVMARSGNVADWQQEGLRRNAEKQFDAAVSQLVVPGLGDATRAQMTTQFGKQLTEITQKFLDSPPMQLQAIGAMRRKSGKGQKPPRGIRAGVGLVGALRSTFGGGQGNLQTYAGYTEGLNSAHIMIANDGMVPDSSGTEPPLWRWQPKMNFDISI